MSVDRELLHELPQQPIRLVRPAEDQRRKIALIVELGSFARHGGGPDQEYLRRRELRYILLNISKCIKKATYGLGLEAVRGATGRSSRGNRLYRLYADRAGQHFGSHYGVLAPAHARERDSFQSDAITGAGQMMTWVRSGAVQGMTAATVMLFTMAAGAEDLALYGAGSLKEAMTEITKTFGAKEGASVRTEFGPSGLMRARIEKGEKVDVFTSADMGHRLKLRSDGRARHVAMFTRNALCAIAKPSVGLTTENFLAKLLDPAVKLGTSTPKADPAGDYTWAMFHLAEAIKPGSYAILDAKARQIFGGAPPDADGGDPTAAALADGRIDMVLGYCTSGRLRLSQMPQLQVVQVPAALRVGAEYGLAVLKDAAPKADDLAFFILSPEGQRILAHYGFNPVGLPEGR
jgi:ABC-type molybdate transport system substrate-binding protein